MNELGSKHKLSKLYLLPCLFFTLVACSDLTSEPPDWTYQRSSFADIASSEEYVLMPTPSDILATRVPRFSGRYAESGVIKILIAGESLSHAEEEQARRQVRFVLDSFGQFDRPFEFAPGKYEFIQFRKWENRLSKVHREFGIFGIGLQQKNQRLRVKVSTNEGQKKLLSNLGNLGIPENAVEVEVASPSIPYQTNRNLVRPIRAGTKVVIRYGPSSGSTHPCTNGFNVFSDGKTYLLLNAHCVVGEPFPFGGYVANQIVNQPQELGTIYRIAKVSHNPISSPSLPGCLPGHVCRYSDAALAAHTTSAGNIDYFGVAQTTNRITVPGVRASGNINSSNPRFDVIGSWLHTEGDTVEKVGQITGWTAGPVIEECSYRHLSLDNGGRLCSAIVQAGGYPGDSGSPVFFWAQGTDQVYAVGILFGGPNPGSAPASGEYYFSPIQGIYLDFLPSFPTGFTYG